MILFPAIDLKDGQCVRLLRGDMEAATVFGEDPAAQAPRWKPERQGHITVRFHQQEVIGAGHHAFAGHERYVR